MITRSQQRKAQFAQEFPLFPRDLVETLLVAHEGYPQLPHDLNEHGDPKLKWERKVEHAVSLYSQGTDCVEASLATGVPLEAIILKKRSLGDDPVRMFSSHR